ncbi:MAG: hypothetical protein HY774_00755 [Acidobacteria bacterium]|nr:hypothetical protein [Acidobacteriota bacterium]
MRIKWDEPKRQLVLAERGVDFAYLQDLVSLPYIEDQKSDDPEQYRIIGFANGMMATFIVEYRFDELGEIMWIVTAWQSTKSERRMYDQETHY